MAELKLVPELRFPEFEGNWKLDKFGKFVSASAFGPRFSSNLYSIEGSISTLRTTDMDIDGNINYDTMPRANIKVSEFEEHILENDDLVISRSGTIGITGIFKKQPYYTLPGAFLIRFRLKLEYIDAYFIKFLFNSSQGRHKLNSLSAGGVQKNLTGTNVKSAEFILPRIEEQQKIASFLTVIDDRIQLLHKKKAKLEEYKKGVMQQIFSQEIRFRDDKGNDFPDWEEKRLGEVYEIVGGGTPSTTNKGFWNGDIEWFTPTEIKSKYIENSSRKITAKGASNSSAKLLPVGTLLFTSRATIGDVGICLKPCTTNQGFQSFLPNEKHSTEFLYYWIIQNKKAFYRKSSGSTFMEISKSEISKIHISLPSLPEQLKISSFLTSLDNSIDSINGEIEGTKEYKKGLLQKMFI